MSSTHEEALDALVRRTEGRQPWRRAFHAANGVAVAVALTSWPFQHSDALILLWAIVAILLGSDFLRLRIRAANRIFFRLFRPLASPREAERVASSTWYMLGIALASTIASVPVAVSGILVMALSDPAASYFGQRWGRRPFLGGSVEGSTLFLLVALAVLTPRHGWWLALAVAVPVTVLERRSWPLDDNLVVPVASAVLLGLLGG